MVTTKNLQKSIMRRVYYTFALRLATHPVTFHILLLVVVGFALMKLVHVSAVLQSFSQVPVGEVLPYLLRLVSHADLPTLIVLGIAMMTALSLRVQLVMPRWLRVQTI